MFFLFALATISRLQVELEMNGSGQLSHVDILLQISFPLIGCTALLWVRYVHLSCLHRPDPFRALGVYFGIGPSAAAFSLLPFLTLSALYLVVQCEPLMRTEMLPIDQQVVQPISAFVMYSNFDYTVRN